MQLSEDHIPSNMNTILAYCIVNLNVNNSLKRSSMLNKLLISVIMRNT